MDSSLDVAGVLAGVAVRDMDVAVGWYSTFFGRRPDQQPMPGLADWSFGGSATVQLVHDPARAGNSLLTLHVTDLEHCRTGLSRRGIELTVLEGSDVVHIGAVTDPEGNAISLVEPKTGFDPHGAA